MSDYDFWEEQEEAEIEYDAQQQEISSAYDEGYQQGRKDTIEEFREYLKTVIPCEMPQKMWNIGVDNTCDRMLKGEEG